MIALLLAPVLAVAAPLALVDDLGATATLAAVPGRVVSISPGATEILFELGAGRTVVGTCAYCTYPAGAATCPRVGDFANPSLEAILAARPGLVVSNGGPQRELVLKLRAQGVPVLVLKPAGVAGVLANISLLGRATGRDRAAGRLVARLRAGVRRVAEGAGAGARPKVYFEIWNDPLTAVGEASTMGELVQLAGGDNIARGVVGEFPRLSAETILAADPDVIFLSHADDPAHAADELARRPGWANLRAVRNRRVYADLDMDALSRPGPRLLAGLESLAVRLRAVRPARP